MVLDVLYFLLLLLEASHNRFYISEIPNQEDVQMASGQGWGRHIRGADNEINRNTQRRRVIMIPSDSRRTSMRFMRTAEATVTMLLEKNPNAKFNMNRTYIDLKMLRVVTPQANQNAVTCHQRGNQQQLVWFVWIILFLWNICIL